VSAIYRYEVPADGEPHRHILGGPVVHVASRSVDAVEFWAVYDVDGVQQQRAFQVVGTGHEIPASATYVGTAVAPGGWLVWHLFEMGGTS
jgi:hypothetical protein